MGLPANPPTDAPAAARAVNLTRTFGRGDTLVTAVDDVSVDVTAGEFTAVTGPSGSGKSTLMHCLAGLDRPTSGTVTVGDRDLTDLSDRQLTGLRRDRVGMIFQSFNLVPTLTAAENITLPGDIAGRRPDPDWYRTVVRRLGLTDRLGHRPSELSGGQQQRVACARALVARPALVIADEPTGNLDSNSSAEVLDILRSAVDEDGQTVLMVTHDPAAAALADREIVLTDGKVTDDRRHGTRAGLP